MEKLLILHYKLKKNQKGRKVMIYPAGKNFTVPEQKPALFLLISGIVPVSLTSQKLVKALPAKPLSSILAR
jgi:hypothetical protein